MSEPHPTSNTIRDVARGYTVVPFPLKRESILSTMHVEQRNSEKQLTPIPNQTKGKKLSSRKTILKRLRKTCMNNGIGKNFEQVRKEIEVQLLDTFSFLGDIDNPAKLDLLEKFNQQIISGEIQTIEDMRRFLTKSEELADCIQLYMYKNQYSEQFTKEISYEVFEQGFSPKNQEEVRKKYPNYFSSNNS